MDTHGIPRKTRRIVKNRNSAVSTHHTHGGNMKLSYNKLWKRLIDLNWTKEDLRKKTKISSTTLAKLNRGDNVTTDILLRICEVLSCDLNDIVETVHEDLAEPTTRNDGKLAD